MQTLSWAPPAITYRGVVYPWQLDRHGRLHVHTHAACFDEASYHLLAMLGLGTHCLEKARRAFVTLAQRIDYAAGAATATALHVESELLEIGTSTLRLRHTLHDSETSQVLSTMERVIAMVGADHRCPVELPASLTRRARVLFPAVGVHAPVQELQLVA